MTDPMTSSLDDWLPEHSLRVAHRRRSDAAPETLWRAASDLEVGESPMLGRLIQWRIPGVPRELPFGRLFREPPFLPLEDREHALITGLVGRIWTLHRDYPELRGPDEFRAWDRGGTSRVVIAIWLEDMTLCSEARVQALGVQGRIGVAAVRPVVRAFEQLIGTETLRAAVRRAESGG